MKTNSLSGRAKDNCSCMIGTAIVCLDKQITSKRMCSLKSLSLPIVCF